jgi:glycosyltransferase involved in cell wall biosynthesis
MPRFILIDPSIRGIGGHHHEYALHVLAAAERAGFETTLATHREYRHTDGGSGDRTPAAVHGVVPLYRYQLYFCLEEWPLLARLVRLMRWVHTVGLRWSVRLRSSQVASWLRRLGDAAREARQDPLGTLRRIGRRWWSPLTIPLLPLALVVGLMLLAVRLLPPRLRPARVMQAALGMAVAGARSGIRGAWWAYQRQMARGRQRAFRRDTLSLIRQLGLSQDDHVFVPTSSLEDMLGLRECLQQSEPARRATWHLVLRYNPYDGRDPGFAAQEPSVRRLRDAFRRFHEGTAGCRVFFYTDTWPLIDQFRRATGERFRLLPIPHTSAPQTDETTTREPLRVIYLGDARNEKGYIFLHRAVRDLWDDYVETGRVCFHLQSNYNLPLGESKAVVGRAQLETLPDAKVHLLRQPLSSDAYRTLLCESHVNLLPYDAERYYARSSGILIESLAAGVPPVVPDGCWLGDELAGVAERHREEVRQGAEILASLEVPPAPGGIVEPWSCAMPIPTGTQALYASLAFGQTLPGVCLEVRIRALRSDGRVIRTSHELRKVSTDGSSLLVPLDPATTRVELTLANAFGDDVIRLNGFRLDAIRHSAFPRGIPRSAVGIAVGNLDDLAAAVAEIVDHHEHYRRSARQHAEAVLQWHNADRLVEELIHASPDTAGSDGKPCGLDVIRQRPLALQEPR